MVIGLDELNIRSMPYEKFFGEIVELSEKEIKKRIKLAEDLEGIYLFFLLWMVELIDKEETNYKPVKLRIARDWEKVASKYLDDEEFLKKYSEEFADNAVESTLRHVSDPWYFSEDRAVFNAENEVLTIFNRADFLDAVERGCKMKIWHSILDSRERKTHGLADGSEVGIFELFNIGSAKLFHPRDVSELGDGILHPEEIVNCRCWCSYH